MFKPHLAVITVLFMMLGSPIVLSDSVALEDQKKQLFEGKGVYRSFNLIRRFKLATAYFVNPSLPDKVKILSAYRSLEVIKEIEAIEAGDPEWVRKHMASGEIQLSVRFPDEDALTLTGLQVPCQQRELAPNDPQDSSTNTSRCDESAFRNSNELKSWFAGLSEDTRKNVYVLAQGDLFSGRGDPVVTWDPREIVSVAHDLIPDLHLM